uniref:Uncharacterized protein n=1 Tax=Oryza brachyantha TaxID=4533 RepID=J3MBL1_ORYBR
MKRLLLGQFDRNFYKSWVKCTQHVNTSARTHTEKGLEKNKTNQRNARIKNSTSPFHESYSIPGVNHSGIISHFTFMKWMGNWQVAAMVDVTSASGDLHAGIEDLGDGPDLQRRADGEQAGEALRRHPHAADVDGLQLPAAADERHQAGLRHVAAAPHYDALHRQSTAKVKRAPCKVI